MLEQYRLYGRLLSLVRSSWDIQQNVKGYNYTVVTDKTTLDISLSLYDNYVGSTAEVLLLTKWQQNKLRKAAQKRYNWLCQYKRKQEAKDALGRLK